MISKFTSVVRIVIAGTLVLFAMHTSKAQVPKTEGFDFTAAGTSWPSNDLPFGWSSGKVAPSTDVNNAWDRCNAATGVLPTCTPYLGSTGMVRFRSAYCLTAGEQGYLATRPYDLSLRGAAASTVSFWMYREGTAGNDNIQVYANTVPDPTTGAPPALMETGAFFVFNVLRPCGSAPAVTCGAWTQYTYTIPGGAPYSIQNLYIIIKVTDAGAAGANVYIDNFSIDTYPNPQAFNSLALAFQNTQGVQLGSNNNWIIGVNVKTNYEGTFCGPLGALTFTHTGSSNPFVDITGGGTSPNVNLWWTGGTPSFSVNAANLPTNAVLYGTYAGAAFPQATFSIPINGTALAQMGGGLHNGNNYFWLTYNVPGSATPGNQLDADFISAAMGGACGTQTCGGTGCALAGSRPIDGNYCVPSYTAGTSWLNGSFTNNDYVRQFKVTCTTPLIDPTFQVMFNDHNDFGPPAGGNDGCALVPNGFSTFSAHPPDYQKFAPALNFPEMGTCTNNATFPAGNCNRTTSFLRDATNPTYRIDVQCGTWGGSNYIAAFIDFNHDYDFNDAGEKIFQSGNMAALAITGGTFTIPVGTYYGPTMMRVREWYAQPNIDACSPGYYGESEDYEVILRPGCSPLYPGWKIWLGYTDDWNLNSNWCGGVPTINDHALIPGKGAQAFNRGAGTYHPVIKSGYLATTRKLVMLNDTVEINAPVPGSLRISDSLSIGVASSVNTSALIVDSAYRDSAQISNGVNANTTLTAFRSAQRLKSQLMYKTFELTAKGLIQGDLIDTIIIPIRQRAAVTPWLNFQISYYYAASGPNYNTGSGFTGTTNLMSVAPNVGYPQQGTVYTNASLSTASIPFNGSGFIKIALTTPIIVNLGGAPLIITMCWDQMGGTNPASDGTWQTQTVGYKSYLQLGVSGNSTPPSPAGCSMVDTTGIAFANASGVVFIRATSDFRPNLTFKFKRVYTKFPIQMEYNGTAPVSTAQWANYGNFIPANSIVTFMSTSAVPQNIDGPNSTTFDELKINNNVGYVYQRRAATVNDTLWLTSGRLYLNGPNTAPMTLTLNNNDKGAITRTSGFLVSENLPPNYGTIRWKMGSATGARLFPFLTGAPSAFTYIPFTYTPGSGTSDLTVGTYYPSTTPPSLLPWPTGVTTINGYNNPLVTNAPNLVKRFWPMTNTGTAPVADLIFGWSGTASEMPTNGAGTYMGQRWDNTGAPIPGFLSVGPGWWPPMLGGAGNLVSVPNVSNFDIAWVLSLQPQPLPVSLLNFTAKPVKDKVKLDWVTASESNNAKFTVERTTDASEYVFIDELQSRGPSTSTLNYTTYDNNPKIGLQYYRLKQVDNNGAETLSKLVPVTFGKDAAFEIVTTVTYDDGSFDVVFNYNSDLPYSYKIIDMLGNVVVAKTDMKAVTGSNIINIKTSLASGVYSFMIQNQEATISRKIFRQ